MSEEEKKASKWAVIVSIVFNAIVKIIEYLSL